MTEPMSNARQKTINDLRREQVTRQWRAIEAAKNFTLNKDGAHRTLFEIALAARLAELKVIEDILARQGIPDSLPPRLA